MGDNARSSAFLLPSGGRDYRHHLTVELEINLRMGQETCLLTDFRWYGHLAF